MTNLSAFRVSVLIYVFMLSLVAGSTVYAQESPALARELAEVLSSAQLDSIAAKDTESDNQFVAALAFPGQLLVVWAQYEVPMYVEEKIANGDYREVYLDLNGASLPNTKVLITDVGADGLSGTDMVDTGSGAVPYAGDASVDGVYARMLRALIDQAR